MAPPQPEAARGAAAAGGTVGVHRRVPHEQIPANPDLRPPTPPKTLTLIRPLTLVIARTRTLALPSPSPLRSRYVRYNTSAVEVPSAPVVAGLPMLRLDLHWITSRQEAQRAPTLREFWRRYLPGEPPQLLYHAQGAQFALPRAVVRRRPRGFYLALLEELYHPDPVASYYLELLWYYVFTDP